MWGVGWGAAAGWGWRRSLPDSKNNPQPWTAAPEVFHRSPSPWPNASSWSLPVVPPSSLLPIPGAGSEHPTLSPSLKGPSSFLSLANKSKNNNNSSHPLRHWAPIPHQGWCSAGHTPGLEESSWQPRGEGSVHRRQRLREAEQLAWGHTAGKWHW